MEASLEINPPCGALGNSHTVVDRVRCSWGYESDVGKRARGPRIPFVDGISVAVELQRPVEVRAFFDRTFSAVFNHPAPEDDAPGVVSRLKLEPDIESVDCTSWEEMSDLARSNHDIHFVRFSGPDYRFHAIDRRSQRRKLHVACGGTNISFFTDGKRGRQLQPGRSAIGRLHFARRRESENIDAENI